MNSAAQQSPSTPDSGQVISANRLGIHSNIVVRNLCLTTRYPIFPKTSAFLVSPIMVSASYHRLGGSIHCASGLHSYSSHCNRTYFLNKTNVSRIVSFKSRTLIFQSLAWGVSKTLGHSPYVLKVVSACLTHKHVSNFGLPIVRLICVKVSLYSTLCFAHMS
jgi:hypothetical protein